MFSQILMTPDWISISLNDGKIIDEKSISNNPVVYDLIIPILLNEEEKRKLKFFGFINKKWQSDSGLFIEEKRNILVVSVTGTFLNKFDGIKRFNLLLEALRVFDIFYNLTRIDYQFSFTTSDSQTIFKEFLETVSPLLFTIKYKNRKFETVTIANTSYEIQMYSKTKELNRNNKRARKSKQSFFTKYIEAEDEIIRIEIRLFRKSKLIKILQDEIKKINNVVDISIEYATSFQKYKITSDLIKMISRQSEVKRRDYDKCN